MRKGINALELIFAMFILIVVAYIVIRLFTSVVGQQTLPDIQDFKDTYGYTQEKQKCENLCENFRMSNCRDYSAAVAYCIKKIRISIDGNSVPGEEKHYGMVAGLPYCEDGLYCFHITDCKCGFQELNTKTCLFVLQTYYKNQGLPDNEIKKVVCSYITPGSCCPGDTCSPKTWPVVPKDFDRDSYPNINATFWWSNAGYESYCLGVGPSRFSCDAGIGRITCRWSECNEGVIALKGQGVDRIEVITEITSPYTFNGNLPAGKYNVTIGCTNPLFAIKITDIEVS